MVGGFVPTELPPPPLPVVARYRWPKIVVRKAAKNSTEITFVWGIQLFNDVNCEFGLFSEHTWGSYIMPLIREECNGGERIPKKEGPSTPGMVTYVIPHDWGYVEDGLKRVCRKLALPEWPVIEHIRVKRGKRINGEAYFLE